TRDLRRRYRYADDRFAGEGKCRPGCQRSGTAGEGPESNLGPLQIQENADGAAGPIRGPADLSTELRVLIVGSMREIESGDIHAGIDEGTDRFRCRGGGSERTDDFGATAHARARRKRWGG